MDKVLVDTSAWIDFFKKKEPIYSRVLDLIDSDNICCIGIVLAELIQGVKNEKEIGHLKDFLYVFTFLNESKELWEKAGELSFTLKKSGNQIGLSDCYIATIAANEKVGILTLDKHFLVIQNQIDLMIL